MPSRAKLRKIELAKRPAKSNAAKVADVTYSELYAALTDLGRIIKTHHEELAILGSNLAEVSLRVRYVMQHFKFQKGSVLTGFDGRPIAGEIATLFDRYNAERERFLASLTLELQDDAPADSHPDAESGERRRTDGAEVAGDAGLRDGDPALHIPGPRLVPAS